VFEYWLTPKSYHRFRDAGDGVFQTFTLTCSKNNGFHPGTFPFAISVGSVALAIGVSATIGILFGWYPAKKASDLQPIEALRYE